MTDGAPPRARSARLRTLARCVALAVVLAGCAGPGPGTAPRPSPSPRTTSPQKLCTRLVTHWAHRLLADAAGGYGDYQSMGLSNGQYEILRTALDAGRAEERSNGPVSARKLIDRQITRSCTERYRGGGPTGGPWQ
ncbi:hypothetical protein ACIOWI_03530 [Streptomyces sp. NPDC087659]|uniref:hypothetical protein n=1 Tax=Streptomyces sp. NPDC087659 TaxID=3365801 RepID=UPI00380B69B9